MKRKLLCQVLLFCLSLSVLYSQSISFPKDKAGKLYTCDGYSLKFKKLVISSDSVTCFTREGVLHYSTENICRLDKRGNHILPATLICGGVGLICGIVIASVWDEDVMGSSKATPILIYTVPLTVTGFIVGISWPKYRTVYAKPRFSYRLTPQCMMAENKVGLGLGIKINLY